MSEKLKALEGQVAALAAQQRSHRRWLLAITIVMALGSGLYWLK